jgi:sulfatase maturation enzyme AslB (radical SAM superfamily)
MSTIERRIERAEERLGLDQGPTVINIVWFGGEPAPPEERRDNFIIRHVAYESVQRPREGGAGHED